jgi:TonB-dependent SusC/RagA subfamily outer membrane receptor
MKAVIKKLDCIIQFVSGKPVMTVVLMLFLSGLSLGIPVSAAEQEIRVTGIIKDEAGLPLAGASVVVEGTTIGVATDIAGKYSISVPAGKSVLVVSFIGYNTQKIEVKGRTTIDIVLLPDLQMIDEVVVVGYGTQKKVNVSGAVDVVTSKAIEKRPVANLSQSLQGVSPSLNVTVGNSGGEMGSKMNINIRGIGSINGGSPYILVDGMEQDINNLNPDDIESISVLKDASSSSIYGARAAFGVILVTTKKGRNDGYSVNYNCTAFC